MPDIYPARCGLGGRSSHLVYDFKAQPGVYVPHLKLTIGFNDQTIF